MQNQGGLGAYYLSQVVTMAKSEWIYDSAGQCLLYYLDE